MTRRTFIASTAVWSVVLVVCGAAVVWSTFLAGDDAYEAIYDATGILALIAYSGPLAGFAAGALAGTFVVRLKDFHLGRASRIVFRIAGVLPIALFCVSPLLIPYVPNAITLALTVVLVVSLEVPWAFVLVGLLFGLGLAPLPPEVAEELERQRAERAAGREVHDAIAERNGTKRKRPHKKGRQKVHR